MYVRVCIYVYISAYTHVRLQDRLAKLKDDISRKEDKVVYEVGQRVEVCMCIYVYERGVRGGAASGGPPQERGVAS